MFFGHFRGVSHRERARAARAAREARAARAARAAREAREACEAREARAAEPRKRRSWVDNTPQAESPLGEPRQRLAVLSERASGSELASASPVGGTTCSLDLSSTVLYIYTVYMFGLGGGAFSILLPIFSESLLHKISLGKQ